MQDHQYLVVRIATDGEGTECECVLSGQTGDWRMLAGGIWRMFATDCHLLIVSSHSFPHLLLLLHSSSTPPSSSAPSSSPTPFCRSQCTVTQAGRGRKLYLYSPHSHSTAQVVFSNFDIDIPKFLFHVNQTKILISPVNWDLCVKTSIQFSSSKQNWPEWNGNGRDCGRDCV